MEVAWDLREVGPVTADHTVLLLPGGMCGAGSYAEVMAEPALAGMRLVAATLPGHAGAPPLEAPGIGACAQHASELATRIGADVVVGFSMGASVAAEMVAAGRFTGPAVLLGISLSAADEPAFFRAIVRSGRVLGGVPAAMLARGAAAMVKRTGLPPERQEELRRDFRRNVSRDVRPALREYLEHLRRYDDPARRLCGAGVPIWIVHAQKGDGGLTEDERRTLAGCSHATLVTIPGELFFLPNEAPGRIAEIIVDAAAHAG